LAFSFVGIVDVLFVELNLDHAIDDEPTICVGCFVTAANENAAHENENERAHALRLLPRLLLRFELVPRRSPAPADFLKQAMGARTPRERARFARRGLATEARLDRTTHAMLLRQLYLSYFEARHFTKALGIAHQALELDVLPDVVHQDAARAALADGDLESALSHLRMASRRSPASRRAFHAWTLGSILFLAQRYDEAISALERASRWATTEKPLYRAHLALARLAAGEPSSELQKTIDALAEAPCGQGYGRFVLGHLAYAAGEFRAARRYLDSFIRRSEARASLGISLAGELRLARATLAKMESN